jgi:hypothetical protein
VNPEVAAAEVQQDALLPLLAAALDDGRSVAERAGALAAVGASGDPRALPFLAAQADRGDPLLGPVVARAALALGDPAGAGIVVRVLRTPRLDRREAEALVDALAATPGDAAGAALWDAAGDSRIPPRLRNRAVDALEAAHADTLTRRGAAPVVPDLLGAGLVLASGATAGGVVLGAVGEVGAWEGGQTVGAIGGAAVGGGLAGLRLTGRPATAAQGLALASGVAWGVTAGFWVPQMVWGSPQYVWPDPQRVRAPSAGLRAAATLGGGAVGWWASHRRLTVGDVVEVDAAGYLAQATTGGSRVAGVPPAPTRRRPPPCPAPSPSIRSRTPARSSRRYATAELLGAAAGLGVGAVVSPRWELSSEDAALALVVGAEGGVAGAARCPTWWASTTTRCAAPSGSRRTAARCWGLTVAELTPTSHGRALATGFRRAGRQRARRRDPAAAGLRRRAFGVDGARRRRGFAGMLAGWAVEPLLDPSPGDTAMIGVSTAIVGSAGAFVGQGLAAGGRWVDPQQGVGLGLVAGGVAGVGTWALVPLVEARADEALVVGSAAALGSMVGGLTTVAAGGSAEAAWFTAGGGELAATLGSAALVSPWVDLEPRRVVLPEVALVSGATLGTLGVALASRDPQDVALGTVCGAGVGLATGVVVEVFARPRVDRGSPVTLRRPTSWRVAPSLARTAAGTAVAGVQVAGF